LGSFSGGSTGLTINSTEPISPNAGEIWSDDSTGSVYVRNSSNTAWVQVSPIDTNIIDTYSTTIGDYTTPTSASGSVTTPFQATQSASQASTVIQNGASDISRAGLKADTGSALLGIAVTKLTFYFGRVGTLDGTVYCRIRDSSDTIRETSTTTLTASTITTTQDTAHEFTFAGTTKLQAGDRILVEYDGTATSSNGIHFRRYNSNNYDGTTTVFSYLTNPSTYTETSGDAKFILDGNDDSAPNVFDDDTGTNQSDTSTNPFIYIDAGSSLNLTAIAIHLNAATDETEIKIQSSSDASTWTDKRTITVSNLTDSAWNYIRFNVVNARYLRVYGNSGSSVTLAINEIKYLTKTALELSANHTHLEISASDTTLGLNGS